MPLPVPQPNPLLASPFLERLILFLMPYFFPVTSDIHTARSEIVEALTSYGARTRSEMLNAAQTIAFGFSALDTLAEAKAMEMPANVRLRFRGCANNLSRSAQQNERTLDKRLACDVPTASEPVPDPLDDMPQAEFEQALLHAHTQIADYRDRLAEAHAAALPKEQPKPPKDLNHRLRDSAMLNTILAELRMPAQPAATA